MSAIKKDPLLVAIDALAVELGIGTDGLAFTWDQLECVNKILAVHAHELAEKIRAVGISHWEGMSEIARAIRDARAAVADLIDPEVAE